MPAMPSIPDARVTDLVEASRLRVGLFPPQYTGNAATGAPGGPWLAVIHALGSHIGVPVEILKLPAPDAMTESMAAGACDMGSLGYDPERAGMVEGFSPAFMQMDYTALVPAGSPIESLATLERPGVRIAAVRGHASTLALARIVKRAAMVDTTTPDEAFELLRTGHADAWATTRPTGSDYASTLPGARLLESSYGANRPALVVAKGQAARLAFVSEFIAQARASGLLATLIAGHPGYTLPD